MVQIGLPGSETIGTPVGIAVDYNYYIRGKTWVEWGSADGVASRTLTQALARNALVRKFRVRVAAARADGTTLANSGQVRLQAEPGDDRKIIVVDFGMLRTVSGIGRVDGAPPMTICSLNAFRGDAFATASLFFEDCDAITVDGLADVDGMAVASIESNTFEVRTERVRITVKTAADLATIAAKLWLQFPDLPSDLDIRVNGAPAWSAPGVAQPNTRGWSANTEQVADLTEALAALTGNPKDPAPLDATIVLSSRIPGLLTLSTEAVDVAYLGRITFDGSEETTLVLDQEGETDIVLHLPAWVNRVQEVRLTLTGTAPPERILQPVGPPIALRTGGGGAAYDLVLDVDHAGAARLDTVPSFGELVAVRLPLRAGADGAEVRAVLNEGTEDGPTRPVNGGTSKPVDLPPATAGAGDVWTSFTFQKPVKLDPALTYWVVVVVGRGGASWSLGRFPSAGAAVPIRRGAATGPWHALPNVMLDGDTLGGRVRAVGKPRPNAPVAPLTFTVVGHTTSQVDATPAPKGTTVTWVAPGVVSDTSHPSFSPTGPGSAPTITLRVTSRMTGTVKLSAVDVVATK
jgi:hypothetical protein